MTRVLVTGANGFVCSNIVFTLLQQGYSVVAVDRAFDAALVEAWTGQPVELITSDLTRLPDSAVDFVIHGAAITADPADGETPAGHFRANVLPALTLLDWAHEHAVKRVIFISSSAVFRGSPISVLTEDTPVATDGLLYAVEKHSVELLLAALKQTYGRDVVAIRLGNIYGEHEHIRATRPRVSLVARLINEALTTGRVSIPRASSPTDWTYAADVGRALSRLLDVPTLPHALYHVTSGQVLTAVDILTALRAALPEVTITAEHTPAVPFRGYMTPDRLFRDTGFKQWTDFRSGLRQTVAWFKAQMEHSS